MTLAPLEIALQALDQHPPAFGRIPEREEALLEIGRFLENHIRAGQPYDLQTVHPNPVWDLMADRLHRVLDRAEQTPAPARGVMLYQLYSSGMLVKGAGSVTAGFDIVPVLRTYGWEDVLGMTDRLADLLDVLFITHRHTDHYDRDLVRACLAHGKPVYIPAHLAGEWDGEENIRPMRHDDRFEVAGLRVHARKGIHVWRESMEEVPLIYYEVVFPCETRLVYGGDVDYTKDLEKTEGRDVDLFFIPWRAPNARYEEGHPEQTGELKEAVEGALWKIGPNALMYEHCAELEHIYDGFPASFNLALNLKRALPVSSELLFWGEVFGPCGTGLSA